MCDKCRCTSGNPYTFRGCLLLSSIGLIVFIIGALWPLMPYLLVCLLFLIMRLFD